MAPSHDVRFGTSTWTYEGWQGLVYNKDYPPRRFKQDCLAEYAQYEYKGARLFHTVGFDFTFYGPPSAEQLSHYAKQLPGGFEACSKVWEEVTIPVYPCHPRYGQNAGRPNPYFLDADYFKEQVLPPYEQAFRRCTGPFIFEFQRSGVDPETFLAKLDHFLKQLSQEYRYAVEVRHPTLLTPEYHAILRNYSVAHVYNHWTHMPSLSEQHRLLQETFTAPFIVMRLLTPRGMKHADAVKAYEPYNRIVRPQLEMRRDTIKLIGQGRRDGRGFYVLVNNRTEGSAPLTIQAIVDQMAEPGGAAERPAGGS